MKHYSKAVQEDPDIELPGVHSISFIDHHQILASIARNENSDIPGGIKLIDGIDVVPYRSEPANYYDIRSYNDGLVVRNGATNNIEVYSVDRIKALDWQLPQGKQRGIAIKDENLLVVDSSSNCVRMYRTNGELIQTITNSDMMNPTYIAATQEGFVVTCQTTGYTVLHISLTGETIWAEDDGEGEGDDDEEEEDSDDEEPTNPEDKIKWATGVCVDQNEDVWICDAKKKRVVMWTHDSTHKFTMLTSEQLGGRRPFSIDICEDKLAVSFIDGTIVKLFKLE